MWNIKKIVMLLLVVFGPISFFYFLSRGEYHFTNLPYLYDGNTEHRPESYNHFVLYDQDSNRITPDSLRNKYVVVTYMDPTCPYDCKIDARLMRFEVYREIVEASGFKDAIIITEMSDSMAAHRKVMEGVMQAEKNKWKFVYSKNFSFFDLELNKTNPYRVRTQDYDTRPMFNMTMKLLRGLYRNVEIPEKDREKLDAYFEEYVYQRSVLILDRELRVRSYLNSSESIEFKRVMEELRLLKKEDAKSKKVLE